MSAGRGGLWGAITDVAGLQVGHAQRVGDGWLTGVTVVLPPPGTVGAVDVRGGGPGTREGDALDPSCLVPTVDAVVLSGGSAYGLATADGVQRWCEAHGLGYAVGAPEDSRPLIVPIVPAAVLFDLGRGGDATRRPDAALGWAAAQASLDDGAPVRGCVGAGTGAVAAGRTLKGGVGTARVLVPGADGGRPLVVGALAAVNALGSPVDPVTGALLGTAFVPPGLPRPPAPTPAEHAAALRRAALRHTGPASGRPPGRLHTTLAVVATDAALDPARTRRLAMAGQDGLARALVPAHTMLDGDVVYALATGAVAADPSRTPALIPALEAAAADAVLLAVLDAVLAATGTSTPALDVPGYCDLYPSCGG